MLIKWHPILNAAHNSGSSPRYCKVCGKPILKNRGGKRTEIDIHPKCLKKK